MFDILKILISDAVFAMIVPGISLGVMCIIVSVFIPPVFQQYRIPLRVGGLILIVFFIFQSGRYSEAIKYKQKALEDAVEIQFYRAKSNEVSVEVITEFVEKTKNVDRWRDVYVDRWIPQTADEKCRINEIAPNFRELHDAAAKGLTPPQIKK